MKASIDSDRLRLHLMSLRGFKRGVRSHEGNFGAMQHSIRVVNKKMKVTRGCVDSLRVKHEKPKNGEI